MRSETGSVRTVAILLAIVLAALGPTVAAQSTAPAARPLDLSAAFAHAVERDATFAATRAETEATQEEIPKAQAALLPSLSLSGVLTRNDLSVTSPNFVGVNEKRTSTYPSETYTLQFRQPLLRYGSWAQLQIARAQADGALARQRNERQLLALKVAESYFNVLNAVEQLNLALAERAAYEASLTAAERGFKAGTGTLTDVADARSRRDQANASVLEIGNVLAKSRRELEMKIAEPITTLATLDPEALVLVPPAPALPEEWVARALVASAEIETAQQNVEAARADVRRQKAQHAPTVDLIAAAQKANNESISTLNQRTQSSYIGVQVSIPLYSGGGVEAGVRQAIARLQRAEHLLEGLRREVEARAREQFDAAVQGIERVRALEQALASAQEAYRGTQKGLQAGTRTSVDLLNAEARVFEARQALAQARYVYVLSLLRLHAVAGTLSDAEVGRVNAWLGGPIAVSGR